MKQGIVVCTWSGGKDWASLCLKSLKSLFGMYPIYVVINDGLNVDQEWVQELSKRYFVLLLATDHRELGAIKGIVDHTDLDEFWFFQDSVEITNPLFIMDSFQKYSGMDITYHNNHLQYYLGMWDASVLRKMKIPLPTTKKEAIDFEWKFTNKYALTKAGLPEDHVLRQGDPICIVIDPEFSHYNTDKNYIETLFGEDRLSVVGSFLIKRLSFAPENLTHGQGEYMTPEYFEEWKSQYRRHQTTRPRSSTG